MLIVFLVGLILLLVILNEKRKDRARQEEIEYNLRLQVQRQAEYDRRKREEQNERRRREREEQDATQSAMVHELEAHLSKLEASRHNSVKAATLEKHISQYADFLAAFAAQSPSHADLITSRYTKPLDYARAKLARMQQHEGKISAPNPQPVKRQRTYYPERNKLTKSLRYEILKRDQFRCTICGRTAEDGVKLHIDHIVPVSKGGETVRENLRVLCADCNLGKSDRMESEA